MYDQEIAKNVSHTGEPEFEYSYITDGIYIGTNQCCQTHFDTSLSEEGIEYDISIEGEHVDQPFGVTGFVWIPVTDHTAPTQEQLTFGTDTLRDLVKRGKKAYVHCRLGHGRGPTIVAAYLIATRNITPQEALEIIHQKRPIIHLDDVQVEALKTYAESLKG